ncbi:YceI family protein [Holophaga foetida]|uniref:YceI family protein n=1 Tax=Holophaga foetida TaxID=35839 RepID=UPI0002474D8A|nr:YceI family protein [Holophaga foetida]
MLTYSIIRKLSAAAFVLCLPLAAADTYTIDAVHSEVGFRIRHLVSKTPGRFTRFQGTIRVDEKQLSQSAVDVVIETASINTDNEARDKHLRSPDFFDVEKFPAITFRSVAVKEVGKGRLQVLGDLTMRGVSRRITIPVGILGTMKGAQNETRGGFEGAVTLNRNDFGITKFPGMLGDDVDITLNIEAVKNEAK